MDIGPEQPPFIAEPLEDPFRKAPAPDTAPPPELAEQPEEVPAGA